MRVLIVNRFFGGEQVPTGRMAFDLAEALQRSGHLASVVTTRGEYGAETEAKPTCICDVKYLWTAGKGGRLANWLLVWLQVCILVPWLPWDKCVFLTDPPFMTVAGWLARLLKPWRRCYWWTMDLYPEGLVASGMLRGDGCAVRLLSWMNEIGLRSTDGVICLGERQRERLRMYRRWKSIPGFCVVQPPWDSRSLRRVPQEENRVRRSLGWGGKKVALYAGNLGLGHSFTDLVEAARIQSMNGDASWHFAFVCRGAKRKDLEDVARGLSNISVHDYVAPDQTADLLWAADVHLITMVDGWDGIVVPSKLYGVLKTGVPVLFIGPPESDTAREVLRLGIGEVLPNGCGGDAVLDAVRRLARTRRGVLAAGDDAPGRIVAFLARL